jgi:hypothetical protein
LQSSEKPAIYVIGLGVKIPDHVTIEAQRAMSACHFIYSIVQEDPSIWLPPQPPNRTPVVNLLHRYVENAPRLENYERAADDIIRSLDSNQTVGYDLELDMAPGIQICEANWLVAADVMPHTGLPLILLQLGTFGSLRTHYQSLPAPSSLEGLVAYLLRYYPPSHEVFLVRSSGETTQASKTAATPLERLGRATRGELLNGSLYIPAKEARQMSPDNVAKLLQK